MDIEQIQPADSPAIARLRFTDVNGNVQERSIPTKPILNIGECALRTEWPEPPAEAPLGRAIIRTDTYPGWVTVPTRLLLS